MIDYYLGFEVFLSRRVDINGLALTLSWVLWVQCFGNKHTVRAEYIVTVKDVSIAQVNNILVGLLML